MKKILIILVIALIVIGGGVGCYIWQKKSASTGDVVAHDINPVELLVFNVTNKNLSEYQIDRDFKRFTNAKNKINNLLASGEAWESNQLFYPWLEVASVLKAIGDYEGAANLWIWFSDAYPHNSISPANLGDLYKSFLVDNNKSEYYYKMAVERDDHDWQIYYGFYELYRYNFKDPDKAIDVLKDGYNKNPDQINYVTEMANYLISLDRKDEARKIIEEYVARHPEDNYLMDKLK